ncbi:HAD family hydrolase [Piscirickettsia salmonis]|uniref:Pyrophosphatase PpaX n=1 Tax=Piscirickettsia salmonis TaxID=1238 RepID=A0A9Q6PXW0_PISSA|nr:HAD-IA family hydrolase [Piscirickettsia salmonis]ALA25999.1 HAD hydrolase, IA, variant 1 family protein [Piscirickettsia salmonis]APS43460.1 HAD family hydrolase [Piscirickettsia salmonis]APS46812.1 HAD family hydrolase [Piscirickettsia salmonis]APS50785.1 HAD family hydrolase [Piscirickettsia salmonis]APS53990.1 HAD family hydrolase [Piscirickettsia salmonis]
MTPTLFFDFDGTLADSFNTAISIINILADQYHFQSIQQDDIAIFKQQSLGKTLKRLGIKWYQLPQIIISARQLFNQKLQEVPTFHYWLPILKQLHQKNVQLIILSSNSEDNIQAFLTQHQWQPYFKQIIAGSSLFGKARLIHKTCNQYNINPKHAYYIGDEARDIKAAKQLQMTSIAVSWGFQCPEFLQQYQPDYLIHHPEKLLEILGIQPV